MSEKFVVGQWVTCGSRIARIDYMTDSMAELSDGQGACLVNMRPFIWQVGRTYKTTLDGVVATIHTICNGRIGVSCGWSHVADPIMARMFHDGTGQLHDFETRTDVPHLLPYLADEPPPVAEAATFSEFAEADECDEPEALQSLLTEFVQERNLCDEQIATWQLKLAEWKVAVRKVEQAIEKAKR